MDDQTDLGPEPTEMDLRVMALMERVSCLGSVIEGTTTTAVHAFLDEELHLGVAYDSQPNPADFDMIKSIERAQMKLIRIVEGKLFEMESYKDYMNSLVVQSINDEAAK